MILCDYDAVINNDSSLLTGIFDMIFGLIKGVVKMMQSIYLFKNVSLFDFLIVLAVMTIVITGLVNVVKSPYASGISDSAKTKTGDEYNYTWIGFVGYDELPQSSSRSQLSPHRR